MSQPGPFSRVHGPHVAVRGPDRTEPRSSKRFFTLLLALAGVATAVLVAPFAPELLFAAVLAAAFSPLYERLTRAMRGHRQLSAILLTAGFTLLILVPVLLTLASAIADVVAASQRVAERIGSEGLEGLLAHVPEALRRRLLEVELDSEALQARVASWSGRLVALTGSALKATSDAVLSLTMLLIALVVFLVEGRRILAWLDDVVPLQHGQTAEIFREFRKIATSVIVGNFGTSAVQSLVALVGFLIAGAPSVLVLTLLTFVMSFVPAVGGAGTCLLVAGGLALAGSPWRALFLAVWAIAVVGVVDNVVKPVLVKRGVELHGALVFFAILSGIAAFGASGLLLGPLIITFGLTLVRIYRRDFKGRDARGNLEPPLAPEPAGPAPPPGARDGATAASPLR